MAPAPLNSRGSRRGGGEDQDAPQNASQNNATNLLTSSQRGPAGAQTKETQGLILIIGRALKRLSLSPEELATWETIKSRLQEPERVLATPELQQIREDL